MKQIVKHEQCQRCRECCRFRADRQYFAPLFTKEEIEQIRQIRTELPEFVPYNEDRTVFQIKLNPAQIEDPIYQYVCPFLDEVNYACTIYDARPFDCRVWPFIVMREAGRTILAHFTGEVCLALDEVEQSDFETYRDYFAALVTSEKFLAFVKAYPDLVWQHTSEGSYKTIHIKDITDAVSAE